MVLPIFFGLVSFVLIAWEFHNERVIQSMGMAWDTGPPVWPYQASWILLQGINAPVRLMDLPVIAAFGLKSGQQPLALELLTILVWWWFIGWRIDFGLVPTQISLHRIWQAVGLWTISLGLLGFLAYLIADQLHFWSEYGTVTGQLMRLMVGSFRLSRAASVAILPSALFWERWFARCQLGVLISAGAAT